MHADRNVSNDPLSPFSLLSKSTQRFLLEVPTRLGHGDVEDTCPTQGNLAQYDVAGRVAHCVEIAI